jgi:putative transcriptional regulator
VLTLQDWPHPAKHPSQVARPGCLLVASEAVLDKNFARTVVLLASSGAEGSTGFVWNRPVDHLRLSGLSTTLLRASSLHIGGPAFGDTLHVIHRLGDLVPGSQQIWPDVHWGGETRDLDRLANSGLVTPRNARLLLGQSTWEPGQLQAEVEEGLWMVITAAMDAVFSASPTGMWERITQSIEQVRLTQKRMMGHSRLN